MKKYIVLITFSLISLAIHSQIPTDGLVGYWPFNGNANDESGNGNHGTVYGAAMVSDRFGNPNCAYLFNGTSNHIRVPSSPSLEDFNTEFTISAWVNMFSYYGNFKFPILDKWKSCGAYGSCQFMAYAVNTSNEGLAIQSINCNVQAVLFGKANELPILNAWEFVTYRYDGTNIDVFVNGALKYSLPNSNPVYLTDGDLVIGKNEFADDAWANGMIDDIRIYNLPLSNLQILELYYENPAWSCGDPVFSGGRLYNTVEIDSLCWMAENINIGTLVSGSQNQSDNGVIEKYCYNNLEANCEIYGGLYQWDEMMQYTLQEGAQGICPNGWHIPTDNEWCTMTIYLDSTVNCNSPGYIGTDIGGRLKESGTIHWAPPNTGATNSSGFTALPGGYRSPGGGFINLNIDAYLATSSEGSSNNAWSRGLAYNHSMIFRDNLIKTNGYSVRCLQNYPPTVSTASVTNIMQTTAISGGNVSSDGGSAVTARGVCWNTSPNPTTADNLTIDGGGLGSYVSALTNLDEGTLYYIRAYATNDIGTSYGNELTFTTLTVPTVITAAISNITSSAATSGGNVTFDGGSTVTARGVCWNTSPNPTTANSHTFDGSGTGTFTSSITGLSAGTQYYVRAYATNLAGTAYGNEFMFTTFFPVCPGIPTVTYQNQVYNTILIGNQCWFKENLNIGTRINGTQAQTNNGLTEKYCFNNQESNCSVYGGLYQWDEMMQYTLQEGTQGICPGGWHIPTDSEFSILTASLGGETIAGGKLKEPGTSHWVPPNTGASNESGFTGLPGGAFRYGIGDYVHLQTSGFFMTSTQNDASTAWRRVLQYNNAGVISDNEVKAYAFSVRCIKNDSTTALNSDFSASPLQGIVPLTVQFIDESTGDPSVWIWDFQNDGVNDAFIQNPTFIYEEAGEYSVRLVVINTTELDTALKINYISVGQDTLQDGLVAYYPFNGNSNDESGNGNDGIVYGASLVADRFGNPNSAYEFNGTNNHIRISSSPSLEDFDNEFTISAWVNMFSYYGDFKFPILDKWEDCGAYGSCQFMAYAVNSSNEGLAIQSINCNVQAVLFGKANELPILNEWEFVTYRYDGVNIDVFVNGTLTYSLPNDASVYVTEGDLVIGKNEFADDAWANGMIDDIRIYNIPLSNEQILELFNESQISNPEICIVTVTSDEHNQVVWEKQATEQIDTFNIYRETTQTNVYELIGTVAYEDSSVYIDISSNPQQRPYKYKISAVSVSGTETSMSNYHRTIHLTINQGTTGWNLIWSPYEGFPLNTYYIYRGTTPGTLEIFDSISASFTSYTDINPPWGPLYYAIEIVKESGCNPTKDGNYSSSRSNIQYNGIVGMTENQASEVKIYPNPTSDLLNIELKEISEGSDVNVNLYDIHGRRVFSQRLINVKTSIRIGNFEPGIYIIRIEYGNEIFTKRLVVL